MAKGAINRRTSERRGRAGSDYPERELTTSREESGARSDYPEARRKKTNVKEEDEVSEANDELLRLLTSIIKSTKEKTE